MDPTRRLGLVLLAACLLAGTLAAHTGPTALGATPPCRVRNVSQETSGHSLIRMVDRARDGDHLRVRGRCRGEVVIDADIVIRGRGGAVLTGRDRTRVVRVEKGALVILRDLVITRGAGEMFGAGISNSGNLRLLDVSVRGNSAAARGWGSGGGIANSGRLVLEDSSVRRNEALRSAGGISNGGWLILRRTTVSGNATTRQQNDPYGGGGIENSFRGRLRLVDSTVRDNRSQDNGGGIYNSGRRGTLTIIRSTIDGNAARGAGGGIANSGSLTLRSSTVSNNDGGFGGGISNPGSATLTDSSVTGNSGWTGGGIASEGSLELAGSSVTGNTAEFEGGGIYNWNGAGTVVLDAASSVTGNIPDDCVGTPAC